MDWRDAGSYEFEPPLTREEWAWQFLRRNPEYRLDHAWFSATWRALEADYGAPPRRDFFRWRQDQRAWRAESEIAGCGVEPCPGENEQVLIECWMGAKWGLARFPIDPVVDRPTPGLELDWRAQSLELAEALPGEESSQSPEKMALVFDLALPLAPQLDQARIRLIGRRHALEAAGRLSPRSVRASVPIWTRWLRLLDGAEAGAELDELAQSLQLADAGAELDNARRMTAAGYRRILWMD